MKDFTAESTELTESLYKTLRVLCVRRGNFL